MARRLLRAGTCAQVSYSHCSSPPPLRSPGIHPAGLQLCNQITNHNADGSAAIQFNGIYNLVPDLTLIVPPAVFN